MGASRPSPNGSPRKRGGPCVVKEYGQEAGPMHFKRRRVKNRRAGCLFCKPHKANGAKDANTTVLGLLKKFEGNSDGGVRIYVK